MDIACIAPVACVLGEGPVWDGAAQRLYWVDIKNPAVHALVPATGAQRRWPMPAPIGAIGLRARGGLVAALKTGFAFVALDGGTVTPIVDPEADRPGNRFNDGHVDARGRFWAGSMDDGEGRPTGDLYRLDADLTVTRFAAGFAVTNGIEWSTDGTTLYFVDSGQRTIYADAFDMAAGRPGARRVFARLTPEQGYPDGLTVDEEDHVWGAHWDGARITRYRPDGTIARVIPMPVPRPTSCCFGGPDLDTLYVTSAAIGLDGSTPLSGGVFAITGLGVRGRPAPRFAG
jgi:sugar lactone lactonase YvrE